MRIEHWTDRKWRPMMGWIYMITCVADFIVFPILWSILQAYYKGQVTNQWDPLTLQGAGLFHMAMGAILGVAVWSRGQEKITGMINGSTQLTTVDANNQQLPKREVNQSISSGVVTSSTGSSPIQDTNKQIVPQGPMPQL